MPQPDSLQAALARLERLAVLTDARFRIPVIGVRFGFDAIIGLFPVIGDAIGALISLYLFVEATRMGAPWSVRLRMLANIGIDFVIGVVPVIGDIGDVAWKANMRNTRLLRGWVEQTLAPQPRRSGAGALLFYLLCALALAAFSLWLVRWLFNYFGA